MLGALGFWTQKSHMLDTAISAFEAIQKQFFRCTLHKHGERPAIAVTVQFVAKILKKGSKRGLKVKKVIMQDF